MTAPRAFWRMWRWPIALGLLTAAGLIAALFNDGGVGDVGAWIALGAPVVTAVWFGFRRV